MYEGLVSHALVGDPSGEPTVLHPLKVYCLVNELRETNLIQGLAPCKRQTQSAEH